MTSPWKPSKEVLLIELRAKIWPEPGPVYTLAISTSYGVFNDCPHEDEDLLDKVWCSETVTAMIVDMKRCDDCILMMYEVLGDDHSFADWIIVEEFCRESETAEQRLQSLRAAAGSFDCEAGVYGEPFRMAILNECTPSILTN